MKKGGKIVALLLAVMMGFLPAQHSVNVYATDSATNTTETTSGFHGGNGTASAPYQIATLEEFELLRTGDTSDMMDGVSLYSDKYFVLTKDINYNGSSNLKKSTAAFYRCKIDGQGHSVNNIVSNGNSLFARMDFLELKNISFNNCKLTNTPLLADRADNCTLTNITVTNGKSDITWIKHSDGRNFYGGMVNEVNYTELNNLKVNMNMTFKGNGYIGLIAGWKTGTMKNCVTSGTITDKPVYDASYLTHQVGGLCGYSFGDIIDSTNKANIKVEALQKDMNVQVAGITAGANSITKPDLSEESFVISGCVNQGNITLNSKYNQYNKRQFCYVAGITTTNETKGTVKNCENKGSITSSENIRTAGIVCESRGTINNSKNSGSITTVNTEETAGICCITYSNITSCENAGNIKGTEKRFFELSGTVSGIANCLDPQKKSVTIDKCKNAGSVTAVCGKWRRYQAAGIVNSMSTYNKNICTIKNSCNCNMITGGWYADGIANSIGSNIHKDSKIKCVIEACVNTGTLNGSNKNVTVSGILGWAENVIIKGCFNYGNIKLKGTTKSKNSAQLVWISNPGTQVTNCSIVKKPENKYPAVCVSQGGKTKNISAVTKTKMKSWNSFKNIIKNAGKK